MDWREKDKNSFVPEHLPAHLFGTGQIKFLPKENVFFNNLGVETKQFYNPAFNCLSEQTEIGIFILQDNRLELSSLKDKLSCNPILDTRRKKMCSQADPRKDRWKYLQVIAENSRCHERHMKTFNRRQIMFRPVC